MSGPFSPVSPTGTPSWTVQSSPDGGFMPVSILGAPSDEVGYGQGGYGEDGYDAPSNPGFAASTPNWTTGSSR